MAEINGVKIYDAMFYSNPAFAIELDGQVFFQRKGINSATETPLSMTEQVLVRVCDFVTSQDPI